MQATIQAQHLGPGMTVRNSSRAKHPGDYQIATVAIKHDTVTVTNKNKTVIKHYLLTDRVLVDTNWKANGANH